ncbi:MAG: TlpA family protein disulfide reductase [Methylococcales bacterium]|nr:TlpA family protein disulfide reductase [Methylococcales bacterium]
MLIIVSVGSTQYVFAEESKINPFIKGSFEAIQKAHSEKPYIISFWSQSCAYCMRELALLGKLRKKYPGVDIVGISTDSLLEEERVNQILSPRNLLDTEKWVFADRYSARLYADVDKKWRGELPLTYFFDKQNKRVKHLGTINKKELTDWFAEQSRSTLQ